jgi:hypothetical protein
LTEDVGHPKLREHLASVTTLMKASDNWDQFKSMLNKSLPRYGEHSVFAVWGLILLSSLSYDPASRLAGVFASALVRLERFPHFPFCVILDRLARLKLHIA